MSLKKLREQRNMTRRELADLSGVNFRSIQDYEQQHKSLASAKGETLYRLSRVLNCTVEELLEDEQTIADFALEFEGNHVLIEDTLTSRDALSSMKTYCRLLSERYGVHGAWRRADGSVYPVGIDEDGTGKPDTSCDIPPVISLGEQDFENLRTRGCFFIDKSTFIREWWESQDSATLIIRPRRFGKTLNLSMVNCFFSKQYAGRSELFEDLSIWKSEEYHALQGNYPVIFLSFANVKGATYENIRQGLIHALVEQYSKHEYLKSVLDEKERLYWDMVRPDMPDDIAVLALNRLSVFLYKYHHKKVLILLDEYDTPLQEAYMCNCWDKLSDFFRPLFQATIKTNPYLERTLLTGITRIGKESLFSDVNHLHVISTSSSLYAGCFGFTEREMKLMVGAYGLAGELSEIQRWYDGFVFGCREHIYNPWSITNFLEEKEYKPYWVNTSSNRLVGKLMQRGTVELKQSVERLLAGESIRTSLDEEIVFSQLEESDDAIWSFLLACGYLKLENVETDTENGERLYTLSLTNLEVKCMMRKLIQGWFSEKQVPYNRFVDALLKCDVDYMNFYMNEISQNIFSYFDVGSGETKTLHPERFYHGFVLGLIVELEKRYDIRSNRESGFGRYDVMLIPLQGNDYAYIIEFKVRNPRREKTLKETLAKAHEQIRERQYVKELEKLGIEGNRVCSLGFAFEGKEVLIGRDDTKGRISHEFGNII